MLSLRGTGRALQISTHNLILNLIEFKCAADCGALYYSRATCIMATEPKNGAPLRDQNIQRTENEAARTQQTMNDLAADLAERRARKAEEAAKKKQT